MGVAMLNHEIKNAIKMTSSHLRTMGAYNNLKIVFHQNMKIKWCQEALKNHYQEF